MCHCIVSLQLMGYRKIWPYMAYGLSLIKHLRCQTPQQGHSYRRKKCLGGGCTLPLSTLLQGHSVASAMFIANLAWGRGAN